MYLNGIFSVFDPSNVHLSFIKNSIISPFCKHANLPLKNVVQPPKIQPSKYVEFCYHDQTVGNFCNILVSLHIIVWQVITYRSFYTLEYSCKLLFYCFKIWSDDPQSTNGKNTKKFLRQDHDLDVICREINQNSG